MNQLLISFLRPVAPIALALIASGLLVAVVGENPLFFAGEIVRFGVLGSGWQNSLTLMAPLMLVAVGLTVAFRAGFWNLGADGQFLIPAVLVAGIGPSLVAAWPLALALPVLIVIAALAGALWAIIPAILRVRNQANEIVTTLSMSFIAIGIANILIRGPFKDETVLVPQTRVIPEDALLAYIPGTRVHVGLLIALATLLIAHVILTRTVFGIRLDVIGDRFEAARRAGIRTGLATLIIFALSGAAIGLAGSVDMLGVWGYARVDWNPAYGIAVIPFVLIARQNLIAVLPMLAFYAVFATGTTIAAQHAGISVDLVIVMVALILGFMAVTEWMFNKRFGGARV